MLLAKIILSGRVQGVGFRYFALDTAQEMQLSGEVWNNYDGTIEMDVFIPSKTELDAFVKRLKKGPALSSVQDCFVTVKPSDPPLVEGFTIKN